MKKGVKKLTSTLLALSLICSGLNSVSYADAAKKPTLKLDKKQSVTVGKTKKLKLKTSGIKKVVSVKWKSAKKAVVKITKSSKKNATVKGLKKGKSVISATVKYKIKTSAKTLSKKVKCTVTVNEATPSPTATVTATPTVAPTATPTPKPTRTPGPKNLLSALGDYVENVGSCVAYGWNNNLDNADVKAYIKENLNSLTAENENKPEAILGRQPNKLRTSQARQQGIFIPDNYNENYVPVLDYTNIDTLMKYAADNGVRVRYHGLLWHEQTSNWFFRENYDSNGAYVTPEVMDARLEYYIKNIMKHVYNSQYGDVVYCWDVVNEFYHMTECISRINNGQSNSKPETVKCYYHIYGQEIFEDPSSPETSKVVDNPRYVKLAFKWAYEVLQELNLLDKVELVYNDYDTNFPDVRASVIAVTSYINAKDDLNPNGDKYCTTIGMQTHDNLEKFFIKDHRDSFEAFTATGLNLQVTEMDVARRTFSVDEQAQYWVDFVKLVIEFAKKGTHFTGFTCWGLTDSASWIGQEDGPLLCGSSVKDKKPVYYKIIEAAYATTID